MNIIEEVMVCQNIIKLHYLEQGGKKSTPKSQIPSKLRFAEL